MRLLSLFLCLAGSSLVVSGASSNQDIVTVTKYIDSAETYNNFQFTKSSVRDIVTNNIGDVKSLFGQYFYSFGDTRERLKRFLTRLYFLRSSSDSLSKERNSLFGLLNERERHELLTAIETLQSYENNSLKANIKRKNLFRGMSRKQQKLCEEIGYLRKLSKIDDLITANQVFLSSVAKLAIEKYELNEEDFQILQNVDLNKNTPSRSNFRAIEALGHYFRDWSI